MHKCSNSLLYQRNCSKYILSPALLLLKYAVFSDCKEKMVRVIKTDYFQKLLYDITLTF